MTETGMTITTPEGVDPAQYLAALAAGAVAVAAPAPAAEAPAVAPTTQAPTMGDGRRAKRKARKYARMAPAAKPQAQALLDAAGDRHGDGEDPPCDGGEPCGRRRWEYLKEFLADEPEPSGGPRRTPALIERMNERGAEGWEVVMMRDEARNVRLDRDAPAVRVSGYNIIWKREAY